MSINWVMPSRRTGFIPLAGEQIIYTSQPRIALAITTPATYTGIDPVAIRCPAGIAYLTNQRIVYLPEHPNDGFSSFSALLLPLKDTHLNMPWFGPNSWQALLKAVPGGNIPATQAHLTLKLTFMDGGATVFHANFERVKERLQQVVAAARQTRPGNRDQENNLTNIDLSAVHLEELPSYQASADDINIVDEDILDAPPFARSRTNQQNLRTVNVTPPILPIPAQAPPDYDESLEQSVQAELDRALSQPR